MKTLIALWMLVLSSSLLKAQDVITLKSGETIQGKVTEVGISEIKYYKAANTQGPVYVLSKADIAQVQYQNKTVDVFNNVVPYYNGNNVPTGAANVRQPDVIVVEQPVPPAVIVQRPYYGLYPRYSVAGHGLFDTHISIGGRHHSYYERQYGKRH